MECRADHFGKIEFDQRCVQKPKTASAINTPCSRDVGAPIVMIDSEGKPKLLGIMSLHRTCVKEGAIFTNVLEHKEWIDIVAFHNGMTKEPDFSPLNLPPANKVWFN